MNNKEWAQMIYDAAKGMDMSPLFVTAQAALESGWGKSSIGNNIFGIKKGSGWIGKTKLVLTHETFTLPNVKFALPEKVVTVTPMANGKYDYLAWLLFREYDSITDCLKDHFELLKSPQFAEDWQYRYDPVKFVQAIQEGKYHYATATNYVTIMDSMFKTVQKLVS